MNYEFDYDHRLRLLKMTFRGELDEKQLVAAVQQLREVISELAPEKSLADFSPVTSLHVPSGTVSSLAHLRPAYPAHVPKVIVAPQDHLFGLARMFQIVGAEARPNLHVVRTMAEACKLLGIEEEPQFERLKVA